jgi:hypothetical protein
MKEAVRKLAALVFRNFGWKLLALAVSVAIWATVASEADMAAFATVRLEYKNLPEGLEISSEPVDTVLLELRGPSGELGSLGQSGGLRPGVVLDMSNVRPHPDWPTGLVYPPVMTSSGYALPARLHGQKGDAPPPELKPGLCVLPFCSDKRMDLDWMLSSFLTCFPLYVPIFLFVV